MNCTNCGLDDGTIYAGEAHRSYGDCFRYLRAKLAEAEKKLPCGHPIVCEVDDHCGRPEHRYCEMCHAGKCWNDLSDSFEKMMDERDALKKRATDAEKDAGAVRALCAIQADGWGAERALADRLAKEIVCVNWADGNCLSGTTDSGKLRALCERCDPCTGLAAHIVARSGDSMKENP